MKSFMKKYVFLLIIAGLAAFLSSCATPEAAGKDTLFQVSTLEALLKGVYDGEMTFGDLRKHGDFGLGTFQALDGEMIAVDGKFYQVLYDGSIRVASDNEKTPFAEVTFFEPDITKKLPAGMDYAAFRKKSDAGFLPDLGLFYAIRIRGTFLKMKTRSVPRQEKPYPPLKEVVKKQSVFDFEKVDGVMAGFRSPAFVKGAGVPGYHLHFISSDRKEGGHVLDFIIDKAVLEIDVTPNLFLVLSE